MLILSATAARAQIRIWADTDERAPSVTLTPYLPATGGNHLSRRQLSLARPSGRGYRRGALVAVTRHCGLCIELSDGGHHPVYHPFAPPFQRSETSGYVPRRSACHPIGARKGTNVEHSNRQCRRDGLLGRGTSGNGGGRICRNRLPGSNRHTRQRVVTAQLCSRSLSRGYTL